MNRQIKTLYIITFCLAINISVNCQQKGKILNNEDLSPKTSTENNSKEELKEPLLIMERTACLWQCPIYTLSIYESGKVIYEGKEFVNIKGKKIISLNSKQLEELNSEIRRANIYSLKDNYVGGPTDAPSVIITIIINGRKKTINHYLGSPDAPKELTDLEEKVDIIVNSVQWIN